jgi:hypothetical protein
MGKQDHRVGAERGLRPGAMLQVLAGAGNGGEGLAAGGRLGNAWHARKRAAGEGNRAGTGRGQRVEVIPAGGGMAAEAERRPEAKNCASGRKQSRGSRARGRRREGRGSGGPVWKSQKSQGPLGKLNFPTDVEV